MKNSFFSLFSMKNILHFVKCESFQCFSIFSIVAQNILHKITKTLQKCCKKLVKLFSMRSQSNMFSGLKNSFQVQFTNGP